MAWTLSQNAGIQSSGSSVSVSFGSAVANNDVVCVFVFYTDSASTNQISSVTDDKSNTYSLVEFKSANPTQVYNAALYWSGGRLTNGPTTITVNLSTSESNVWVTMGDFTPPSGTLAVDGHATAYINTSNPSVGPITTTQNGDLIFGAGAIASDSTSEGSGYTRVNLTGSGNTVRSEFQTQTSAGSISANWSGTTTDGIFGVFALSAVSGVTVAMADWSSKLLRYFTGWTPNASLLRSKAQDLSSFGVETNPHWRGRVFIPQWNPLAALMRNPAVDVPLTAQPETNTYIISKMFPLQWNPMPLGRTTAQDFSSFGVETNPHSKPGQWPMIWVPRPMMAANDSPVLQASTPPHWMGKFQLPQWSPLASLMRNTADSPLIDAPTYFLLRVWPLQWNPLPSSRPPQDLSTITPETNTYSIPRTWPLSWILNTGLFRFFPQDFTTQPPVVPIATYYLLEDYWSNAVPGGVLLPAGTIQQTFPAGLLPMNWMPGPDVDPMDANAIAAYTAAGFRPRGLSRTQYSSRLVYPPNYVWQLVQGQYQLVKVASWPRNPPIGDE